MCKVIPLLMPDFGNSMEEGTILEWNVVEGDEIKVGDVLCQVETDKAVMEFESPVAGRLAKIYVAAGEATPVRQPIAYFASEGVDVDAFLSAEVEQPRPADLSQETRVKASPAVRRQARERQIDLTLIEGSGPGGRIVTSDLPSSSQDQATVSKHDDIGLTRQPLSKMRRAIAHRLQAAKRDIPHFYLRQTIDATSLVTFYKQQVDGSLNDIIVLACARVAQEFPAFRSRIEAEEIVEQASSHMGIAVSLDEGLVVPVVLHADRMTLQQLATETKKVIQEAQRGKVSETDQAVMTISNLGMFGVEEFAAIINPPESAILAVGAIREDVIVSGGAMRLGHVMTMTLSANHQVVDGRVAAAFMNRLQEILESPADLVSG